MNPKRFLLAVIMGIFAIGSAIGQDIKIPATAARAHPRFLPPGTSKASVLDLIKTETWAKNTFDHTRTGIEELVNRHQTDPTWIVSRLQMYWNTKSTTVYIKGGVYDHAEGQAPNATVKFPGARDNVTIYAAPKLEDILPYMDDPKGILVINKTKPGQPLEWADISKTGRIIESINTQIMSLAYNAAVLYWLNGEDKYARFAADLFDTYMTGMQYRNEPYDLTHGHHQTLAGLSTFEVIQEVAILNHLTGTYDYLYGYLKKIHPEKMQVYTGVFRKWADIQILHGVAFNNWNLMQARNVLNIALILDDDTGYKDGKGSQYYTHYILNKTSQRQWSLQKIVGEGYDPSTGLWNESPGYSFVVLNDLMGFVYFFDTYYQIDLVERMPILKKAVTGVAQYLFPNGFHSSFGDSHYGRINLSAAHRMIANSRKYNKPDQEKYFSSYIKAVQQFYNERGYVPEMNEGGKGKSINSVLYKETSIEPESNATADITAFVTPVLSSSHVSYFALRNGLDMQNGLMMAMSGSKGNHMHAGGISLEIYGKGYVLGPESGIGTSYFQSDYAEYYSQFPAHNTVAVDGLSAYPVMKSNHGFEVKNCYPASGLSTGYFPSVSFGDLYFLEPETSSDQRRLVSIIRTSDSTGYYIDIFRSRRKDGKDKMHDYFYHNMGQQLVITDNTGDTLALQAAEELSFGGGHLFAYDYFYDKKSITTQKDINAIFKLAIAGKEEVHMNMWMKGEKDRVVFSVKSPKSKAIERMGLAKDIAELPMPTIVARQTGEAWTKPFAVVFEPSTASQPRSVASIHSFSPAKSVSDFTGLVIESRNGEKQFVFSGSGIGNAVTYLDMGFNGTYGVVSETKRGFQYLFLGYGKSIAKGAYSIRSGSQATTAALERKHNTWYFTSGVAVSLTIPVADIGDRSTVRLVSNGKTIKITGRRTTVNKKAAFVFDMPALSYTKIDFE